MKLVDTSEGKVSWGKLNGTYRRISGVAFESLSCCNDEITTIGE